jgi:hypothetical protein
MAQNKLELQVDVKDNASPELIRLRKELEALGGPAAVKAQREANKLKREINMLGGTAKITTPIWTRFTQGIAIGNLAAMGAAKAMGLVRDGLSQLAEAAQVAARIEVLNGVMQFTGQQAGYSAEQLAKNNRALRAQGIAQSEALGIQQRFIQANLDISMATDIATVAQNAAVIAGENSSEAALGLTDAIVKQRPVLLKQYGIITDLNTIYGAMAEKLGKTTDELNETEKRMAFFDEIMRQATTISGAYTTAMDFAGKRLTSLPRLYQDAQEAIGRHFLPAMNSAISVTEGFLKALTSIFGDTTDLALMQLEKLGGATERYVKSSDRILEMANRYDELQSKLNRNAQEQSELNVLLEDLAKLQPGIVTGWDNMGRAIGINTAALREAIGAQRQFNILADKKMISDLGDAYSENADRIRHLSNEITYWKRQQQVWAFSAHAVESYAESIAGAEKELRGLRFDQEQLVAGIREEFPDLVEGTAQWASAIRLVPVEYARMALASTVAAETQKKTGEEAIRLWAEMRQAALDFNDDVLVAEEQRSDETANNLDLLTRQRKAMLDRALADESDFEDSSNAGWDRWLELHTYRTQKQIEDEREAAREREKIEQEHQSLMADVDALAFENSLIGLSDFQAGIETLDREKQLREAAYREDKLWSEEELKAVMWESEVAYNEAVRELYDREAEETARLWEDRLGLITDSAEIFVGELTTGITTNVDDMQAHMSKAFDRIGQSIVHNLAVKGVQALTQYIVKQTVAKTTTTLFDGVTKKETISVGAAGIAKTQTAVATMGLSAATMKATGAMVGEAVAVKALTKAYINLAAAKAAASLGTTAGASIGGAVAVKSALSGLLGFDDPRNDAIAYRHGQDYADQFMAGLRSRWGSPRFGMDVRDTLPEGSISGGASTVILNLTVEGSILSEDEMASKAIWLIERAVEERNSQLLMNEDNLTGGRI